MFALTEEQESVRISMRLFALLERRSRTSPLFPYPPV